jgi:hypothetical protein
MFIRLVLFTVVSGLVACGGKEGKKKNRCLIRALPHRQLK